MLWKFKRHKRFQRMLFSLDNIEFRSCVDVEVAVLGSPSLTVPMVSVDVRQH